MKELSINTITSGISKFLLRYHFVLFIMIVVGCMAFVVWIIGNILASAADTSPLVNTSTKQTLDTKTIDRVDALRSSQDQSDLVIPQNTRTNPFTE